MVATLLGAYLVGRGMSDLSVDDLENASFETTITEEIESLAEGAYFDITDRHRVKDAVLKEVEAALTGSSGHTIRRQDGTQRKYVVHLSDVSALFTHIDFDHQTGGEANRRALEEFNGNFRIVIVEE